LADKLKIIFGRSPPDALITDGAYGFHFLEGGSGFDSFPSAHAAMAAGVAAGASVLWPAHRRLFMGLAAVVAASRFIVGAHYVSDTLLGFAVGLGAVVLMQLVFHHCGIQLKPKDDRF
jgi:undecaprenyl-diphosphatase